MVENDPRYGHVNTLQNWKNYCRKCLYFFFANCKSELRIANNLFVIVTVLPHLIHKVVELSHTINPIRLFSSIERRLILISQVEQMKFRHLEFSSYSFHLTQQFTSGSSPSKGATTKLWSDAKLRNILSIENRLDFSIWVTFASSLLIENFLEIVQSNFGI